MHKQCMTTIYVIYKAVDITQTYPFIVDLCDVIKITVKLGSTILYHMVYCGLIVP